MALTTPKPLFLAGALALPAQQSNLKGNYDTKSGLITPALESGIDVQVVTTDSVPGKQCEALAGLGRQTRLGCAAGIGRGGCDIAR